MHYGSYETVFLKRMRARYGGPRVGSAAATALERAVNLVTFVFARIYFPTFSNSLKEIAGFLGFRWSASPASGLEAIIWRHGWEASRDPAAKQALLDYNQEDCEAPEIAANSVIDLYHTAPAEQKSPRNDVVLTGEMKRESLFGFGRIEFALPEMETINKAAYWDYQRERIYVKSAKRPRHRRQSTSTLPFKLRPNATIDYPRPSCCPDCKSKKVYGHDWRNKIIIDLRFMKHGIKRWIKRYVIHRYRCQSCGSTFSPSNIRWTPAKYGPSGVDGYRRSASLAVKKCERRRNRQFAIRSGKAGGLVWKFTKHGTFEFACLIPGHHEDGMLASKQRTCSKKPSSALARNYVDQMLDGLYVLESAMRHFEDRAEMGKSAGRRAEEVDEDYKQAAALAALAAPYRHARLSTVKLAGEPIPNARLG